MATNKKRKKKAEVMAEDGSMTLTGHLKELRNRLIICAVVFVVGVVVSVVSTAQAVVGSILMSMTRLISRDNARFFIFLPPLL